MELTEKDIKRFWNKVNKKNDEECWEWNGYHIENRGRFNINGKIYKAHRISYYLATGNLPEYPLEVRHKCKIKLCVNPNHLETGTHTENMHDKYRDETILIGENHQNSKLTEQQVLEIRTKYIPYKYSAQKLALEYNVSSRLILKIINNQIWKHIL
jgi:hypothetical protein